MSIEEKAIAIFLLCAVLIGGFFGIKHLGVIDGRAEVQALWDKDKIKRDDAQTLAIKNRDAENENDRAKQKAINDDITKGKTDELDKVRSDLAAVKRVRVGPAFCGRNGPAGQTNSTSSSSSNGNSASSGLLPESVDGRVKQLILESEETAATARAAQKFIRDNGLAP